MNLGIQIVFFFLAFLGAWWLVEGSVSIVAAVIGTATALGLTRLIKGRWTLY